MSTYNSSNSVRLAQAEVIPPAPHWADTAREADDILGYDEEGGFR